MSGLGSPVAKRTRYSQNSSSSDSNGSSSTSRPRQNRYMLRSNTKQIDAEIVFAKLPEPKRKIKQLTFGSLNNDCLLKIMEYLSPIDLCDVAEVSHALNQLAKYFFRLKYKDFNCTFPLGLYVDEETVLDEFERLFRIFGDQISSLRIKSDFLYDGGSYDSTEVQRIVNKYCSQSLKEVTFEGFQCLTFRPQQLFSHIESLTLINCYEPQFDIKSMTNLKVLKLDGCEELNAFDFVNASFPKLERIQLKYIMDLTNHSLHNFIALTPSLKSFSITSCCGISSIISNSVNSLQDLEEFVCQQNQPMRLEKRFQDDLMHLTSLKKLKVLKLNCNGVPVLRLLDGFAAAEVALEHLQLENGPIDNDFTDSIIKLKSLKVLKLSEMTDLKEMYIMRIFRELKLLEEVHIKSQSKMSRFGPKRMVRDAALLKCLKIDMPEFTFDEEAYQAVLTEIAGRASCIKLNLTIYGNGNQLMVPKETLKGYNEKWLSVQELNRNHNSLFPSYEFLDAFFDDDMDDMDDEFD